MTHDQEEALEVADRVVVMNQARIEQVGTPDEVFHQPQSEFVMQFLGHVNVFHGRVNKGAAVLGDVRIDYPEYVQDVERAASVYMRPHELEIQRHSNGKPSLPGAVRRIHSAGAHTKVVVAIENGQDLIVELPQDEQRDLGLKVGDKVFVYPKAMRVFIPDYHI